MQIENNTKYEKILASLYGQAYADAFGMPSELWTRPKVKEFFGKINMFLPGPPENTAANGFLAGQFTDDTSQALALLDSIIESKGEINSYKVAEHILDWAKKINAFEKNILGPSSKKALTSLSEGKEIDKLENLGTTNGAAMRISPIGMIYSIKNIKDFEKNIYKSCAPTHKSDVAIAGAGAIAYTISSLIDGNNWDKTIENTIDFSQYLQNKYHNTFSPFIYRRILLAIEIANKFLDKLDNNNIILTKNDEDFSQEIYEIIGSDMQTYNSVPAAFAIAHYCQNNPIKVAHISANLGGDTDTIGAMSLAMCATNHTSKIFPNKDILLLEKVNNVNFKDYAMKILTLRKNINKKS